MRHLHKFTGRRRRQHSSLINAPCQGSQLRPDTCRLGFKNGNGCQLLPGNNICGRAKMSDFNSTVYGCLWYCFTASLHLHVTGGITTQHHSWARRSWRRPSAPCDCTLAVMLSKMFHANKWSLRKTPSFIAVAHAMHTKQLFWLNLVQLCCQERTLRMTAAAGSKFSGFEASLNIFDKKLLSQVSNQQTFPTPKTQTACRLQWLGATPPSPSAPKHPPGREAMIWSQPTVFCMNRKKHVNLSKIGSSMKQRNSMKICYKPVCLQENKYPNSFEY